MMVKILMLTGDAGEAQEIYYAKFRLEEEGWQVHIATTEKRVFHSVVHDFEPGSTPTPRSRAIACKPTSGSTKSRRRISRAGSARRPCSRISEEPTEGSGDRSPFHRGGKADRGELPWPALAAGSRRHERPENDVLPGPRTRPPDRRGSSSSIKRWSLMAPWSRSEAGPTMDHG